jgi:hypothetical protein
MIKYRIFQPALIRQVFIVALLNVRFQDKKSNLVVAFIVLEKLFSI